MLKPQRTVALHQNEMVDECRSTRERMMRAMHALEAALAKPSPGRQTAWDSRVREELATLEQTMLQQDAELEGEDNVLAAIARDQPRLLPQIQQLRQQFADLVRQISTFRDQLSAKGAPHTAETRQRLAWILTAVRHFQAKETDLIFEALHVDIGAAD